MSWRHDKSRHERGYGAQWEKLRLIVLARDDFMCRVCMARGRPTPATQVDHIVPKARGGSDDMGNLQAICDDCHKAKTASERLGRPMPVYGADGWREY